MDRRFVGHKVSRLLSQTSSLYPRGEVTRCNPVGNMSSTLVDALNRDAR